MPLRDWYELGPFTVFDVETTGMSPVGDRIVELAAIRIDPDGSQSRFQTLVNPGCPIPAAASRVHRISDDMVADAPHFKQAGYDFLTFARQSTLVAHNARFDLAFLQESLARCGLPLWQGKTMDSLRLIRQTHAGLPSYSLQNLRLAFNLDQPAGECQPHRAAADVDWTMQILAISLQEILKHQPS